MWSLRLASVIVEGSVILGPINIDAATSLAQPELHFLQNLFLKRHDRKTKRLWFLWPPNDQVCLFHQLINYYMLIISRDITKLVVIMNIVLVLCTS